MPTIFTIPKPFTDPKINIIQTNAITSWSKLGEDFEIILIGDEIGVSKITQKLDLRQIKKVKTNEFGTPLLSSAFALARAAGRTNVLIYANSDIIFLSDFTKIFKYLPANNYLAAGRRWDLDVDEFMDFARPNWREELKIKIKKNGRLHSPAGIDYYIFPKNLPLNLPDFAVGRVGWDNWVIHQAKKKKIPLIDITGFTQAVHQNHDYPAFNKGAERKTNPEAKKNFSFSDSLTNIYNLEDADYKLTETGLKKNYLRWYSFLKRYLKFKLKI